MIIKIGKDKLTRVNNFVYLGIHFNHKRIDTKSHLQSLNEKMDKKIQFFALLGMNKGGFRPVTKSLLYKSFIRSVLEYGVAILKFNKKQMKKLEGIQYTVLCKMFSVHRNSSSKTLQMITGLLPMMNREKILKLKWIKRYNELAENENMLLPKVDTFMRNIDLKTRFEEIMNEISNEFDMDTQMETKEIVKFYTDNIFEESKQNIKIMVDTPLKNMKNKELYKIICGTHGSKEDIQMLSLFLLNKIPGKPNKCNKCDEHISKAHLVQCNMTKWADMIERLSKVKYINNEILKINNFMTTTSLWPFIMFILISNIKRGKFKEIVIKEFAETLRESLKECAKYVNKRNLR